MKALIIHTQYMENYNVGESGLPWWKPKGGDNYWIANVDMDEMYANKALFIIKLFSGHLLNDYHAQEYVLEHSFMDIEEAETNTVREYWDEEYINKFSVIPEISSLRQIHKGLWDES